MRLTRRSETVDKVFPRERIRWSTAAILLLLVTALLPAEGSLWWGPRVNAGFALGSGSGYWDWTTPVQAGSFHPGFSASGGLEVRRTAGSTLEFSAGLLAATAVTSQKVDGRTITYREHSLRLPVLAHVGTPLGAGRLAVVVGPTLAVLPWEAERVEDGSPSLRTSAGAQSPLQVGVEAGVEWGVPVTSERRVVLGLRFVHLMVSPEYPWVESSAGNTRIDRLDLSVALLQSVGDAAEAAPRPPPHPRPQQIPPPGRFRLGLDLAAATAIGTGKAHWDWYGGGAVHRLVPPGGSAGVYLSVPLTDSFAIATGGRYAINATVMEANGTEGRYRHDSVEVPLLAELRVAPLVIWGGPALVWLPAAATLSPAGAFAVATGTPARSLHPGMDVGLGVEYGAVRTFARYVTFLTSPDYPRMDDHPAADLRWHRFELGLTWYLLR